VALRTVRGAENDDDEGDDDETGWLVDDVDVNAAW
jgi:hypothetical protein